MKKNFKLALLSATAFVGAVSFTACSSDEEVVENPNFDPEKNEVTTQFVLNVAYGEKPTTRQSATTVQQNNNFRGMQNAKLIALGTGNSTYLAPYLGGATTATNYVKKTFDLGTLYTSTMVDNSVSNNQSVNQTSSSRRVLQLQLPVSTDAMLVYAKAIPTGDAEVDGKVKMDVQATPETSSFELVSRLDDSGKAEELDQTLNLAAFLFNRIMDSSVEEYKASENSNQNYAHGTYTAASTDLNAVTWKTITGSGLPETLRSAYDKMAVKTGEYRNGSSKGLRYQILDLYKTIMGVLSATATNDVELNAQRLATEIQTRIEEFFDINLNAEPNTISFNKIGSKTTTKTIKYALINRAAPIIEEADFNTKYGKVEDSFLEDFPGGIFGLPEGVALLKSGETGFEYQGSSNAAPSSLLEKTGHLSVNNYMYPAELLYFDNSALRVSSLPKKESDYPNGYGVWDNNDEWDGWENGAVSSATQSVAVKNNINYGVAMLETIVGIDNNLTISGNSTPFVDNRNAVTGENDQQFGVSLINGFELTGVLVGNQFKKVGWNYIAEPVGEGSSETNPASNFAIYDKNINSSTVPTVSGNVASYTLVFDNYNPVGDQTEDVFVALEFVNKSKKAFYGVENLIPDGETFYLVGKLTLSKSTNTPLSWDSHYAIPPYTSVGVSMEKNRVFIQNYVTSATFKFGANSLKNAYLTVPDLRSTQMSLGLSVDLSWKTGNIFEVTLGDTTSGD